MALTQTPEEGLKVSNAPSDGKFLQYKDSTDKLTWTTVSTDVVSDTTPQLGGDLDIQARKITTSTTNGNVAIEPNGTGKTIVGTGSAAALIEGNDSANQSIYLQSSHAKVFVGSGANGTVQLLPAGTGTVDLGGSTAKLGLSNTEQKLTTHMSGAHINIEPAGTSGNIKVKSGANEDIEITPNGTGDVVIDGLKYPQADGSAGQFLKTDGSAQLSWATVSTSVTTTSGTDNFTVADGNLVIGTSGHGIDFSATANGSGVSSESELFSDYEHGKFTPTLFLGSTEVSYDAANTEGYYVKMGKLVWINAIITVTSQNSATAGLNLRGFPFDQETSDKPRGGGYICQWYGQPSGWTNQPIMLSMDTNNKCYFRFYNGSYMGDLNGNHLDDAYWFQYVITYFAT